LAKLWRSVDSNIRENEVISLLREIVKVPSSIGIEDGERKVAQIIASYFRSNGIESNIEAVGAGVNIFASVGAGIEGVPSMMLNGHLDTVPAGNMSVPPFEAMAKEGILYGRGACDMKGGLASMAAALVALKRSQVNINGTVLFAGVSGEESGSPGTRRIVQKGPRTDCAIVGEPTRLKIALASQGMVYARIVVKGKAAHGSAPWKGINAIEKATKIVACMNKSLPRVLNTKRHKLLGSPSYNIGVMRAGTQPNIVPDQCFMMIDRRIIPGERTDELKREFEMIVEEAKKDDPDVNADVTIDGVIMPPMNTPIDARFAKCLIRAVEEVHGKPELVGLSGSTDGNLLSEGGVPSLVFGPGDFDKAHSANESINLEEVVKATKIYAHTALTYLS
jgi:acetylornithine deacetylase/succinyl-diaminopimelate desuccinylase family protein